MSASMTDTAMTEALGRFLDVDVARYKLIAEQYGKHRHARLSHPRSRFPRRVAAGRGRGVEPRRS